MALGKVWFLTLPTTDIAKWKKAFDKSKVFWILILNISKWFDHSRNNILIAKLSADEFSIPAVKLMSCKFKIKIKGQKLVLHTVFGKELPPESHNVQS